MRAKKIKSLVSVLAIAAGIIMFNPISASAEWRQDEYGWWNTEGSSYSTGWRNIDNAWYYFGSDGYMKTGWIKDDGKWYYLNPASDGTMGTMKTGWIKDNGTWYYLSPLSNGSQGVMQTGWITVNNNTYYLNQSGAMVTGEVTLDGIKYTFASSGEKISSTSVTNSSNKDTTTANNNNSNTENSTSSSTSGGGGGSSSSSTKDNSTNFLKYSDLYGTWTIDSYVENSGMNTSLSDNEIKFVVGLDFTVSKDKIYYDALINVSNPTIKESVLTNSEFKNKFGTNISKLGISGDKINCITVSAKDNSNKTRTGYVIVSSDKDVYAIVKGAAFKLKKA